jgi:hypothetical protein
LGNNKNEDMDITTKDKKVSVNLGGDYNLRAAIASG